MIRALPLKNEIVKELLYHFAKLISVVKRTDVCQRTATSSRHFIHLSQSDEFI